MFFYVSASSSAPANVKVTVILALIYETKVMKACPISSRNAIMGCVYKQVWSTERVLMSGELDASSAKESLNGAGACPLGDWLGRLFHSPGCSK